MKTGIFIIAHAPLASALRECVLHVYPECASGVVAYDVQAKASAELSLDGARAVMGQLQGDDVLILTDVMGATPCNVAQKLVDGVHSQLVAGANLPMLLRTVNYQNESLNQLTLRALTGGAQCITQIAPSSFSNQP
jgi:PTS system ascorbate-specific IIA component